jgi:hypothetical protein
MSMTARPPSTGVRPAQYGGRTGTGALRPLAAMSLPVPGDAR